MPDFKSLQCFTELVQSKSFSATADKLCLTQPSVSKIMAALEAEFGVPLLEKHSGRRKRSLEPTEIGRIVYRHALSLLEQRRALYQEIDDYRQVKTGTLRIGISLLGSNLLTGALFHYHQRWPQIELAFLEEGAHTIEKALLDNALDVGVLLEPVGDAFEHISLCDYPLMVVVRRDSPAAKKSALPLRALRHESFVLFTQSFALSNIIDQACRGQGFEPNVVCRTSQWDLIINMVAQNMGLALLPAYYADRLNPATHAAVPLIEPEIHWRLAMAWKKHQPPTPALKAWIGVVQESFGQAP